MNYIYNSWSKKYKSKFGALETGDSCRFSIRLPKGTVIDSNPVLIIFRNGFRERFLTMAKIYTTDEYTEYSTTYYPDFMGVHFYYFGFIKNGTRFFVKRINASEGVIGEGELFQLTVYDKNFSAPDFIKGGIMYQIFPDRFNKSNTPKDNVPADRYIHSSWDETPFFKPDGNGRVLNNDYFGGDLKGITEKLDYLKSMGVTCIYLNPIFESHENHRYSTADYMRVDPLLGTNEDFKELCENAKGKGIRIILDGVFNHTGADSIYFNKNNRYDNVGAYNSKSSPYYSWYSFIKYPDVYESWWGIDTLPNVNESDKDFSEYICGDKGVLKYWLSLGASGFRLDVADELPDSFLDLINRCVKDDSQQNLIIGEVWEDASNKESYGVKRRYLLGQQLDSVMNYPFKDAIIFYIKGGSPKIFNDWIMTILENYPKPSIDCLMNFLSTHDIQRAITVFGGQDADGQCKEWQAEKYLNEYEYINGKNLFKCAVVLQYFLPGVPCIYYGDEAGMQGYCDPFNRRCYPWGKEDNDLLDYFKKMGEYRAACSEYMTGRCEILVCENDYISFLRYNSNENKAVLITLNKSNNNIEANLGKMINSSFNYSKSITGSNNIFSHNINSRDFSIIELISKNN